ncbi:MAG: hypothetical protein ABEJ83_03375 [Candidatus Nanohaloarchaea archaeon]
MNVTKLIPNFLRRRYLNFKGKKEAEIKRPVLIFVLDACRYDSFKKAYQNEFPAELKKKYTHATWTAPSHVSLIRGRFHIGGEVYEKLENKYPHAVYPMPLVHNASFAVVSAGPLSNSPFVDSDIQRFFQDYYSVTGASHEEIERRAEQFLSKYQNKNFFGLINFDETHFRFPTISPEFEELKPAFEEGEITKEQLIYHQKLAAETLIASIENLRKFIPPGTRVIATSDHGELFGEGGGFLHGGSKLPEFHEKLFEVPLITWIE